MNFSINEPEISRFLQYINRKMEEKRVGRSPQEIWVLPTYRNVLIPALKAQDEGKINGIVPRYGEFSFIVALYLPD
jgi:hypothetical protein